MIEVIKISVSLMPVFLFLITLIILDSFKLVSWQNLVVFLAWGCVAALLSLIINSGLLTHAPVPPDIYRKYGSPAVEELAKSLLVIYYISRHRLGFLVDAAIAGFAAGAGFAFIENIWYLQHMDSANILLWVIRGFGTAIMHGGTVCILAIISKSLTERHFSGAWHWFLPGLIAATVLHSFFNHFVLSPVFMTLLQITVLPAGILLVYGFSERALKDWLEVGLDVDVWLLDQINSGDFERTKIGSYLVSLKEKFRGEVIADMLCLLRLNLELAIRAKGILLMKEAGFAKPVDQEIRQKLEELKYLESNIGKTGLLALAPMLHTTSRELWQLYLVAEK